MDWEDPIPGDPDGVESASGRYLTTADSIREAATELRRVANEIQTVSLAIDATRSMTDDLVHVIDGAETRYRQAGEALRTYSVALRIAQLEHNEAALAARNSTSDLDVASYNRDYYHELAETPGPEQMEMIEKFRFWRDRAIEADHARQNAVARADDARSDVENAAQVAIDAISLAMELSGLNDTLADHWNQFWEGVGEWWENEFLPWLDDFVAALEAIASYLAPALLVLSFVAMFVPGLNVIVSALTLVALAVSAAVFIGTTILAMNNRRSVVDVITSGISLALAVMGPLANLSRSGGTLVYSVNAPGHVLKSGAASAIDDAVNVTSAATWKSLLTTSVWRPSTPMVSEVGDFLFDDAADFAIERAVGFVAEDVERQLGAR